MDSNQNNDTGKSAKDDVAGEQNILPNDTPPPELLEEPLPDTSSPQIASPMEVHHHTHTPLKKWKHYLWEFLMLFLAVFCGFLAENQREHFIEHSREKQFIHSLIADMKTDIARLAQLVENRNDRESKLDSLLFFLNSEEAEQQSKHIYFLATTIPRTTSIQFTPNDGTMQQLKNSGGLRLIRNGIVADSIINYDAAIRTLHRLNDEEQTTVNNQRELASKILNGLELGKFTDENNLPQRLDYNPPLMSDYKSFLNEFNYRLVSVKNVNKVYRREARKLLQQANNLLSTLKEKYHIQ